jgi:hypothetical protein
MAGQSWSIKIVPSNGGVSLDPDVYGVRPGTPLKAGVGDLVSWNNESGEKRTISVAQIGDIASEALDVGAWSSTTAYTIRQPTGMSPPFTITYTCTTQQGNQRGSIDVTS